LERRHREVEKSTILDHRTISVIYALTIAIVGIGTTSCWGSAVSLLLPTVWVGSHDVARNVVVVIVVVVEQLILVLDFG
jgi:hypothetical protein